jgi:hypothetical protein
MILAAMIVEGMPRTITRPPPESDVTVTAFCCHTEGETERLVRVDGLDACDYLTGAEARALARALDAAVDELAGCGLT